VLAEEEEAAAAAAAANEDYQSWSDVNMIVDDDDLTLPHFDRGQFHGAPGTGSRAMPAIEEDAAAAVTSARAEGRAMAAQVAAAAKVTAAYQVQGLGFRV
jgi:hypothetical protein